MAETPRSDPFLSVAETAKRLKVKVSTLEKWRILGSGPAYRTHGSVIVYHIEDLDSWSETRRRTQTAGTRRKPDKPAPRTGE